MEFQDYYKTLGVDPGADDATIKAEYRKLARKYHPDLNKDDAAAEARFKEVNEAHEVLSDPEKRKKYDELRLYRETYGDRPGGNPFGNGPQGFEGFSGSGGFSGFEGFSGFHSSGANQAGQSSGFHASGFGTEGGFGDFSEFFEQLFGGHTRPGAGATRATGGVFRGADLKSSLPVSLEDCYHGGERSFELNGETIKVKIPRGFPENGTLKLAGQGQPGMNGGPRGDLYLKLTPQKGAKFERRENDLHYDFSVDMYTMLLGGSEEIATPAGTLKLTIPPASQNGAVLRLKGMGMPHFGKEKEFGDLFVRLVVRLPSELNDAERETFQKLAGTRKTSAPGTS